MINNIIILDQSPFIRLGLKILLQEHCYKITSETSDTKGLLHAIYCCQADLLIMEHSFQSENMLERVRTIKRAFPTLKILIFTEAESAFYSAYFKQLGVDGYFCKTATQAEISKCLDLLNDDKKFFPQMPSETASTLPNDNQYLTQLSEHELYIFQQFCLENRPQKIARKMNITEKKVSAYKVSMMHKMKVKSTVDMLEIARRNHIF